MTITVNTKSYVADVSPNANTTVYRGPAATFGVKDQLVLSRTAPKATAEYPGNARARIKFARTLQYNATTGETADAIIEVNVSIPVGVATASIDSLRDDMGDLLIASVADEIIRLHKIAGH